jgi:copper homeostasis protein
MKTELCAYSIEACRIAQRCGVDRVELCASPQEGGITPSLALIEAARWVEGVSLQVMIRPRGGDFLYSDEEFEVMLRDVALAREAGADGVVFGLLLSDGRVDRVRTARLVEEARGMESTFHRAFDMCADHLSALEEVIATGCRRLLTSGGYDRAEEGVEMLRRAVAQADHRIEVMAGSGVGPSNAMLLASTGVDALHFGARAWRPSQMIYRNERISMGGSGVDEYALRTVDEEAIRAIVAQIKQ